MRDLVAISEPRPHQRRIGMTPVLPTTAFRSQYEDREVQVRGFRTGVQVLPT